MSEQLLKFESSSGGDKHVEAKFEEINDNRGVIYGVVIDKYNKPVCDAVVKLILLDDPEDNGSVIPVAHTFTDEYGQFLFGPLLPDKTYLIKVWYDDILIRKVAVKEPETRHSCITIRESFKQQDDEDIVNKSEDELPFYHSKK